MGAALASSRPDRPDFGAPPRHAFRRGGKAVFLSDFMGPRDEIFPALAYAAECGVSGCYVQIVDPAEEAFPFDGRLVFESLGGGVEFETHRARGLRRAYLERLRGADPRASRRAAGSGRRRTRSVGQGPGRAPGVGRGLRPGARSHRRRARR